MFTFTASQTKDKLLKEFIRIYLDAINLALWLQMTELVNNVDVEEDSKWALKSLKAIVSGHYVFYQPLRKSHLD